MPRQNPGLAVFHVQDDDRPMWVVAETWAAALERWREFIRSENEDDPCDEPIEPSGIAIVCDPDDLLLPVPDCTAECCCEKCGPPAEASAELCGESTGALPEGWKCTRPKGHAALCGSPLGRPSDV